MDDLKDRVDEGCIVATQLAIRVEAVE